MPFFAAQEFLETVAVVLEVVEEPAAGSRRVPRGGRDRSPPLLRFVAPGLRDRGTSIGRGTGSRRTSRDSASSADSARRSSSSSVPEEAGGATAAAAADYARCRTRLFGWLFRPLLSDAFALASLTQALSLLGLGGGNGQAAVLVRDLAAWFLELPVGRAADTTVGREAQNCPVLRWLKGVILAWASSSTKRSSAGSGGGGGEDVDDGGSFLDRETAAPPDTESRMKDLFGDPVVRGGGVLGAGGKDDAYGGEAASSAGVNSARDEQEGSDGTVGDDDDDEGAAEEVEAGERDAEEILRPMLEACAASQRLENASMLSVVTAEALAACREKLEESSLGQVAIGGGEAWVTLARRLRLCLFLDHRLHWGVLAEQRRGWEPDWGGGERRRAVKPMRDFELRALLLGGCVLGVSVGEGLWAVSRGLRASYSLCVVYESCINRGIFARDKTTRHSSYRRQVDV